MRWSHVACGLALLLVGAYLDNIRGPLLPVISHALGLPYSRSSWLIVAGNLAAVTTTLALMPLSRLFGDRALALGVCALGAAAALVVSRVTGLASLVFGGVLWGATIAAFGAMSNLLVIKGTDTETRARFMCGLHMMYGLGSFLGPGVVGYILGSGGTWHQPLLVSLPALFALAVFLYRGFPPGHDLQDMPPGAARLSRVQVLILIVFAAYVVGEVLTSTWLTAYLVEVRRMPLGQATSVLSGFFLLIAATRALCFLSLTPRWELRVLWGSVVAAAGFFVLGHRGFTWSFAFSGVMGPFFPLFMARASRAFPKQSRALALWILTSVQLTLAAFNLSLGRLADTLGMERAYWLPLPMLAVSLAVLALYRREERRLLPA